MTPNKNKTKLAIRDLLPLCEYTWALPYFQRDYIWVKKNVIGFLDSIYKQWPTGLLIVWKTNCHHGRHFGTLWENPKDNYSPEGLVLDGQQRLTTLKILRDKGSLFLKGEHGNREHYYFYFDLDSLEFISSTERLNDPNRIDVNDILNEKLNDKPFHTESRKKKTTIGELKKMLNYELPIWHVSTKLHKHAIQIFDRVNTGGKKIDKIDIAFAQIKDKYPQLAKKIIDHQREWVANGFDLNDRVIMNSFLVVNGITSEDWTPGTRKPDKRVETYLETAEPKDIEKDWDKTKERLEDALQFLKDAGFDSDQFLTTDNTIVSLCGYFEANCVHKLSTRKKNELLKWLYRTILLGRYSSTVEFTQDLKDLHEYKQFEKAMRIPKNRLKDRSQYTPEGILGIMYALGIRKQMKDYEGHPISWFNSKNNGKRIHIDHIYPRAPLKSSPISEEIYEETVEDFGNKAFIVGTVNMSKSKKFPGELIKGKIDKRNVAQWLNTGHKFLIKQDYERMKKHSSVLRAKCKEIVNFIDNRHKKILAEIKKEIGLY